MRFFVDLLGRRLTLCMSCHFLASVNEVSSSIVFLVVNVTICVKAYHFQYSSNNVSIVDARLFALSGQCLQFAIYASFPSKDATAITYLISVGKSFFSIFILIYAKQAKNQRSVIFAIY